MSNMWLYHMGPQWAKYMMMTGDTIDGEMAEKSVPVFRRRVIVVQEGQSDGVRAGGHEQGDGVGSRVGVGEEKIGPGVAVHRHANLGQHARSGGAAGQNREDVIAGGGNVHGGFNPAVAVEISNAT